MSKERIVRYRHDPANPPILSAEAKRRLDAMTDEDILEAAMSDPDCPPLTEEQLARFKRAPNPKRIRE